MHIKKQTLIIWLAVTTLLALISVWPVLAGNINSPAVPGSTSGFTLEQIYNAITSNGAHNATPQTSFTEPTSGPGSTMHSLDEIMAGLIGQVPKTGQTACYNVSGTVVGCDGTGQDAEHRMGSLPVQEPATGLTGAYTIASWEGTRFTDNSDGTVTDNVTGLVWLQNANCFGAKNWTTALSDANGLASGACDLTDSSSAGDWRLPNVNELHSLIDLTQLNPALPSGHLFGSSVQSSYYWSSTSFAGNTSIAWFVYLSFGRVSYDYKSFDFYVWPVRAGQ